MKTLAVFITLGLVGCSALTTRPKPPTLSVLSSADGSREVKQTGEASSPAHVSTVTMRSEVPIPPGATFTLTTAPKAHGEAPSPNPVAVVTETREVIETPTAFTPPAPPSASELAKADGVRVFYYLAAALAVGAVVFAYLQHYKAAVIAAAGAVAVPVLINFASSEWAMRAFLVAAVGSVALYAAWHFIIRKHPELAIKDLTS